MKKILLSLSFITVAFMGKAQNCSELFISEYLEGTQNTKAIEIYNPTNAAISLSNYRLVRYSNGSSTGADSTDFTSTLSIGSYSTFVIANGVGVTSQTTSTSPACDPALQALAQQIDQPYPNPTAMNGDDAMVLVRKSPYARIDIFGKIGEDPGASWGTTPFITVDKTLVRKSTITGGVTTNPASGVPTLATEWDSYNVDVATYLGSHTMSGSATSTPISGSPFAVSGATSKTLTGLSAETTYYYTVVAKKGVESSVASNEISATTSVSTALNNGKAGAPFITTAKGKITINQLAANSTVRVYDATGRMVATKVSANGSVQIPLQVAGVYTVRIAAGVKNWTMKVVNSNL